MEGRLQGVRILVTRPRERSRSLCFLLEDEGAEVTSLPLLELLPPRDERPLQAAAEQIQRYRWIALASPSAVQALVDAARRAGTLELLQQAELAVVGPGTARTLEALDLRVSFQAEPATGIGLAKGLLARMQPEESVLFPVAEQGRREGLDLLREAGVSVTEVVAYRTEGVELEPSVWSEMAQRPPQVVLFASPRTTEAFLEAGPQAKALLQTAHVIAIGPTTGAALEAQGVQGVTTASEPTDEGLLEAAVRARSPRASA
jgi:uroporphyrinogen-III synthase